MTTHELPPQGERIEIEGTDAISLRQLVIDDAQTYFDLIEYNRLHLSQHEDTTAEKYKTVEDVRESIRNPNPFRLRFGVWVSDKMVGTINLDRTEIEHHGRNGVEVGYWIGKEHIGHGFASKALKTIIPFAFEQPNTERLYAQVHEDNRASIKTLERCDFTLVKKPEFGWAEFELLKPRDINRLTP